MARVGALASLAATVLAATLLSGAHAAKNVTIEVPGSANLWLAGGNPAPGNGPGTEPPSIRIPDGATSFKAVRVTGLVSCCSDAPTIGPDGGGTATSITPTTGSIGPYEGPSNLPLLGLFLKGEAAGGPPPDLNRDDDGDFRTASPKLKQPFFIGSGDTSAGVRQTFRIPDGARRLFLGIPDSFNFNGPPDSYHDNNGSFTAVIRFATGSLPAPTLGKTANAKAVKGTVLVGIPSRGARAAQKGVKFVPLEQARSIPIGSFLDTTKGTVALTTARDRAAKTQTGRFSAGLFQVLQSRKQSAKGLTDLRMKGSAAGFKRCDDSNRGARASLSRRTVRRLRGSAKGRYRTRGRHSAATVRGTVWNVADRCDGTLTTVKRGEVAVRDFRLRETISLTAGKSYLARAPAD